MATVEDTGVGLEFLSDPVDRFPLPDLEAGDLTLGADTDTNLTQSAADSSMGDVGDTPLPLQLAITNSCEALCLSVAHLEESSKNQGSGGWTKSQNGTDGWVPRVLLGDTAGRML
ncbi:hypothetical protein VPH35_025186 [Triticum aestivum]